jgi:hypothetical protein
MNHCSMLNVTNYRLRLMGLIDEDAKKMRGESWSKIFN